MTLQKKGLLSLCLGVAAVLVAFSATLAAQEPDQPSGWIVISSDEYRSLHSKAYPMEPQPEEAPIEATLTRIDYDLQIKGGLAAGQAKLTIDVIKDGWVSVPIPSSLLVREAKLDGKLISLVPDTYKPGGRAVALSHTGRAELKLDIVLPVASKAMNKSLTLPPAVAGITRASVQLPRQGVDIKLTGGFLSEKSASDTESRWVAYGKGNAPLVFSWWRKTEDHRSDQPLRLRGSLTQIFGLGEDATSVQAEVKAEILQGAAREMKLQFPEKVTINQVGGAMVADWEAKPGELTVTFLEPVEKNARFLLVGEIPTPRDGQIEIPLLRLLDVERESGGVAVEVLGAGEITDRKAVGLKNSDASELSDIVSNRQSPSLIAFQFRSGDSKAKRSLTVDVARYTQESVLMANIEEARYQILLSEEGKTLVHARYAIRNNRKNFLKIALPPNAVLWSAVLSGKSIRPGQSPDGSLLLPLKKGRVGGEMPAFAAEIFYLIRDGEWDKKGKVQLALPELDLPVSRTGLHCFYPSLFKVKAEPGSFRQQEYKSPFSPVLKRGSESGTTQGSTAAVPDNTPPDMSSDVMDLVNIMGGVADKEAKALKKKKEAVTQTLVDKHQAQTQKSKGFQTLPVKLSFPLFGPSVFLVSELTAENQTPKIDLSYEATKKGGAR